jgi:hypothetical protein
MIVKSSSCRSFVCQPFADQLNKLDETRTKLLIQLAFRNALTQQQACSKHSKIILYATRPVLAKWGEARSRNLRNGRTRLRQI